MNIVVNNLVFYVGVAQLDRAFGYGPKGRGFESSRPRFKSLQIVCGDFYHIGRLFAGRGIP